MYLSNANLLCETRLEELKLGKRRKDENSVKVFQREKEVMLKNEWGVNSSGPRLDVGQLIALSAPQTVRHTEVEVEGDAEVVKDH